MTFKKARSHWRSLCTASLTLQHFIAKVNRNKSLRRTKPTRVIHLNSIQWIVLLHFKWEAGNYFKSILLSNLRSYFSFKCKRIPIPTSLFIMLFRYFWFFPLRYRGKWKNLVHICLRPPPYHTHRFFFLICQIHYVHCSVCIRAPSISHLLTIRYKLSSFKTNACNWF